ncbi:2-keto-4-pentenoate hydratase [Streptomyces sp. NPDC057620]|uniref:2-keto-4-pentenoate hydratase n=1 Tax=Streptomyces sp. NPDC057620 TaxID=3346185 RepID=UPI0036B2FCBB
MKIFEPSASGPAEDEWPPLLGALHVFTSPGRLQDGTLAAAAADLSAAERSRTPTAHLTRRHAGLTLEQAYRIQWTNVSRRVAGGARIVGHKVGLTSPAMQHQFGVDQPDSGALLDDMLLTDGSTLRLGDLMTPRIEAEIAFRLGRDLHGPDVDGCDVHAAVDEVLLALEVIDTRYGDWRMTLADSVADNASAAWAVLGQGVALSAGLDLACEPVTVRVDQQTVVTALSGAVLGNPLRAVAWLARQLSPYGGGLRAGDLVLAGAVHASLPLRAHSEIAVVSPHLPPVRVRTL